MHARAHLLLALVLGGCSMAGSLPDWISDDAAGPEPTNYRFIVANGFSAVIVRETQSRVLEITNPRRVDVAKGATWMVCVKILTYPARQARAHYAVFIRNEKVIDYRISIGTDQCEIQSYAPFEWSVDIDNPR